MSPSNLSDMRGPHVREAIAADDWAGLVRYAMAHRHGPALDEAIAIVRCRAAEQPSPWQAITEHLAQFRQAPFEPQLPLPKEITSNLSEAERATLLLVYLYPRAALCETASRYPIEQQAELFRIGLLAVEQACLAAEAAHDEPAWAFFRAVLGTGYQAVRDLAPARDSYNEAITVYRKLASQCPDVYHPFVANTLNNLGIVQGDLSQLEAACGSYVEALAIRRELARQRPDLYRSDLAMTLNNLGTAQSALHQLEAARQSHAEALALRRELASQRRETYLPDVAMSLNNLATVQATLLQLEEACASFTEALALYRELAQHTPNAYCPLVATTLSNLGSLQSDLHQWEAARDNLVEALALRRELAQQRPEVHLPDVATTLNNLGNVRFALQELEAALECLNGALALQRDLALQHPDVSRADVAKSLNNLGNVQRLLHQMEAARDSFAEAVAIRRELAHERRDVHLPDVAMALSNLGVVQRELGQLTAARDSCAEAVVIYRDLVCLRPEMYSPALAIALTNLGSVQLVLLELPNAYDTYTEALTLFRELAHSRPDVYRTHLATTLSNLGNVQREQEQWEAARESYVEALSIRRELARQRPDVCLPDVAMSLNNLGAVHSDLSELTAARDVYVEAAELYEAAALHNPTARLVERQDCWSNLALICLRESALLGWPDFDAARRVLREARRCSEIIRGSFLDQAERRRVQDEALRVYDLSFHTCVEIWRRRADPDALTEAVEVAEASRARNLMELLADEALQPAHAPPDLVQDFRELRRRLRQADRRLRDEEGQSANDAFHIGRLDALRHEVESLRHQYAERLQWIRAGYDAEFDPDQPVRPIDFATVRQLLPTDVPTAIVQYTLTADRGVALILTPDEAFAVPLPDLSEPRAADLARAWFEAYYQRDGGPAARDLTAVPSAASWDEALPRLLEPVAEHAVQPVMEALAGKGIQRLILSPNRALHIFPLHACRLADGHYLADVCEVVYTPSLSILHRCASRSRTERSRLLLADNPTGDLPFTAIEGTDIVRRYISPAVLHRCDAHRDRLCREASACHVLHYAGHACFDVDDPLRSALVLGDKGDPERWLTLRDIFCTLHLPHNTLTVISGCESGLQKPDRVDEYVGLPSGFLYAGAACVVSTLWALNDLAGALLMHRFHAEWLDGQSVAAALRAAQRWLRDDIVSGPYLRDVVLPQLLPAIDDDALRDECRRAVEWYVQRYPDRPPFASPAHWGPFIATGLAYPLEPR